MSPTPLIELQRRLAIVGAIRAGGERPSSGRAPGRKLEAWRITSPRRQLCEQAAVLYGGEVSQWQSPVGVEFQVYTTVDELPVLVMPGYSLRQSYELWEGATKRTRLCDGVEEELTGQPCICNAEGRDRCSPYTRLTVALPELDTALGFRVVSTGIYAALELPAMLALIQQIGGDRTFVPARLRLDQRRGVVDGQTTRFVVPTIDLGVGYIALAASASDGSVRALEAGPVPISREQPTIGQALDAVASPAPVPSRAGSRQAAAFGPDDVDADTAPMPEVPPDGEQGSAKPTEKMVKHLNVLVGKLRDAGILTTDQLYDAVAQRLRGTAGLDLAMTLEAYDEDAVLHWSPLRDSLTSLEAHTLIDWLTKLDARAKAERAGDASEQPVATPSEASPEPPPPPPEPDPPDDPELVSDEGPEPEDPPSGGVPYGEFPPGY